MPDIPERVRKKLLATETVVLLFGASNVDKDDVDRLDMIQRGEDKTMSEEMKKIFMSSTIVCVSDMSDYTWLDDISIEDDNDINRIYVPMDFNNVMSIVRLRKLIGGRVELITFDWSVTKFIDWTPRWVTTCVMKLLSPTGKLYCPVELNMIFRPAGSDTPNADEIALLNNGVCYWHCTEVQYRGVGTVNVYELKNVDDKLHTGIYTHIRGMMNKEKVVVVSSLDRNYKGTTMEGSSTIDLLTNHMKTHVTSDNSVKYVLGHRIDGYRSNMMTTRFDEQIKNRVFIFPSYFSQIDDALEFFSNVKGHNASVTSEWVMTRDRWKKKDMKWIVVSRNNES
jgi:hypothetical protein